MMLTQTMTLSFKTELVQGIHNLASDVLYIALYTSAAALDATTTAYTSVGEVSATGYTAGGQILTGASVSGSGSTVYVNFSSPIWSGAFTARGALIYNSSKANRAVAVLDFGADKISVNTFTVVMPANTATTALLRF